METKSLLEKLRLGQPPDFPSEALTSDFSLLLDAQDGLRHLQDEFELPSIASVQRTLLTEVQTQNTQGRSAEKAIYLSANSQGLLPKAAKTHIEAQIKVWSSIGVYGHTRTLQGSPIGEWQFLADGVAARCAKLVGGLSSEVAIMNTTSVNLHLMMASFYRPTATRNKIIVEWRPFPSDYFVIESQIAWHGLDPASTIVRIQPDTDLYLSTDSILSTITVHASDAAMIVLPGVHYLTGQLLDIPTITAHAHACGLLVGWDLAHAVGNVPLSLHDWDVDWAVWCTYKYLSAGPGSIAGAFVHERHAGRPRLKGWYGHEQATRLRMDTEFVAAAGAAGFQLSGPSALDLACVSGALTVFEKTDMGALRDKSMLMTAYMEFLLDGIKGEGVGEDAFDIITQRSPLERGAQLSVRVRDDLLDAVFESLTAAGVVCDKRKPSVFRFAPSPLYCTFHDVWRFGEVFKTAVVACCTKSSPRA